MTRLLALAAVAALCAACTAAPATTPAATSQAPTVAPTATQATPSPGALRQVHDPGQVTGTLTGPCHARDGGQLPDPACTPGAYDPAVTAAVLCAPGYTTASYRPPSSQTTAFKHHDAYPAYGIADVPGTVSELDHLISLELGGANDAANLWPELGTIPNPKDSVENALAKWVCQAAGGEAETRLHDARAAIAADWTTAEQVLHVNGG